MNSAMHLVSNLSVGTKVEVCKYADYAGQSEPWTGGYTVRTVEYEDYVVEKDGVAFALACNRVRAAAV